LIAMLAIAAGPRTAPAPIHRAAVVDPGLAALNAPVPPLVVDRAEGHPVAAIPAPAHLRRKRRTQIARPGSGQPEHGRGGEDCDPPYTLSASGERHFKLRCLVDVRR
jgi:hypothetical protein